jgi:hypothetical protein
MRGVPLNLLLNSQTVFMLMSWPNSVGIDPASANEDVFKASGRLVLPHQENEQRGRTAQFVFLEIKVSQVDELAEFGGDRPCQRK